MQVLFELLKNINVTFLFVVALEHNPIYSRFMDKFLSKQRELQEIERAQTMGIRTLVPKKRKELEWWKRIVERKSQSEEEENLSKEESVFN